MTEAQVFNLKLLLMELGNKLVQYGFDPAPGAEGWKPTGELILPKNTLPIKEFSKWINENHEVQIALANLDVSWPME